MLRGLGETRGTRLYEEIIEHGRNLSVTSLTRHKFHEIMSLYLLIASGIISDNFIFYVVVSCLPLPKQGKMQVGKQKIPSNDENLFLMFYRLTL